MKPAGLLLALAAPTALLWAQGLAGPCSCGTNPPGPPKNRELRPYADTPADMQPYAKFGDKAGEPYYEFYTNLIEYNGAARDVPTLKPADVDEVRIGFLGPIENHPEEPLGRMMLAGVQLAIEEANAAGGYGGKPFKLMIHNDQAVWGASSNEIVKMAYDEKVWAMLGSVGADSTHIALRVTLKAEVPIVNSASTDPTIPETIIPWYLTTIQDDRVQGYTLARRIYTDLGLQRIALLRVNSRYGRFGILKFKDVSRRMGHPVVMEQKWMPGDMDFKRQLRIISESRVRRHRHLGRRQGSRHRAQADARDGDEAAGIRQFPHHRAGADRDRRRRRGRASRPSTRTIRRGTIRRWVAFKERFRKKFGKEPEAFASLGYDTMNILLQAICKGGLNRGKIRDALTGLEHYKGVTGGMVFDPNCKNIVPMYLATVKQGKLEFRRYPMKKEYARVGENGVEYNGPALADAPSGPLRIGLFGPGADKAALELAGVLEAYKGRYEVVPITANTPWGQGSTELVKLIYEPSTIGMISTDRNTSHLAEQLAIKSFVPLIAISGDKSLTAVNIPWIFRLPADASLPDALRSMIEAAEKSGPNRGRLRAALASSARFDSKGDPR